MNTGLSQDKSRPTHPVCVVYADLCMAVVRCNVALIHEVGGIHMAMAMSPRAKCKQ